MPFPPPTLDADPLDTFRLWYDDAWGTEGSDREMMALATVGGDGRPSARMVLFRGLEDGRLRFYTHYESRKGRDLAANPHAALLFHWRAAKRQVRIEGSVERLAPSVSDAYFASRPRASQLSAAVSPQSEPIGHRDELVAAREALADRLAGAAVPRPLAWGGFGVLPEAIELWSDDPERLHHRWRFERDGARWSAAALAP